MNKNRDLPEVTIVLPCLNEAETLQQCLDDARSWLDKVSISGEIIVADNGSTDGSIEIAQQNLAKIVHITKKGYGAALQGGIQASSGRLVLMGDADHSYDFSDLDLFYEAFLSGSDLIIGNRFLGGIDAGAMPWKNRMIGNPILSSLARVLFGIRIGDFHCGLRAIKKARFDEIQTSSSGMEWASEMIIKAHAANLNITEVPTRLRRDGRSRSPHLSPWMDGLRHLILMFILAPGWIFWMPGVCLSSFGAFTFTTLIAGPTQAFGLGFDIKTMIFSNAIFLIGMFLLLTFLTLKTLGEAKGICKENRIAKMLSSNKTLVCMFFLGVALALVGFGLSVTVILDWGSFNYGVFTSAEAVRTVTTATMLMTSGASAILWAITLIAAKISLTNSYTGSTKNE